MDVKGPIRDPTIRIAVSEKLHTYLKDTVNTDTDADIPPSIRRIVASEEGFGGTGKKGVRRRRGGKSDVKESANRQTLVDVGDLKWLHKFISSRNDGVHYFSSLLENSEVILPKNEVIPRSEELEKRCQLIKKRLQNAEYNKMTANITATRKMPQDSIGQELKQMQRDLILVLQFVFAIFTGFMFGFMGIQALVGSQILEVRLLQGIVCAIIIALTELYFVAKSLNMR